MKSVDVRRKFIEFYKVRGHVEIPSAPLVPENDPTTLFTSSGMQPLIPYLLGQEHPAGKRLVNSQQSFRAGDIEEVGDNRHTTFFEMLGNWSFGDYFKKEQLPWIWEFITKELGLAKDRLYVSVFSGEAGSGFAGEGKSLIPKDTESAGIWKNLGIADNHIYYYGVNKNWWSRSGEPEKMPPGEPGGPDSEVFYDFGEELGLHEKSPFKNEKCHPNCDCGRFLEIANSVFMQYQKQEDGSLKELAQKNVDFGGGLERLVAATEETPDIFTTDLFAPIIAVAEILSGKAYGRDPAVTQAMRIVADHIKGAVMMMADGVLPSNKMQGYVLRRLIRRALFYGRKLGLLKEWNYVGQLVGPIVQMYEGAYPAVTQKASEITLLLEEEAMRFGKTLDRGIREIEKVSMLDGKIAFMLYETYGFPWEMTVEVASGKGQQVNRGEFEEEFKKHQTLSRTAAAGMFKGGLADQSEKTTKLHTATHLLHEALHRVLGHQVSQKGSNITAQRLRFDFSHPTKLTADQIKKIEDLVNEKIGQNLPVSFTTLDKDEATRSGARAFFGQRYGDKVKVYQIGGPNKPFSREICGGPHVAFTGVLGRFTIIKEESAGAGIRRIYATVSQDEAARRTQPYSSSKA